MSRKEVVLNTSTSVDDIFNEVAKERMEDIQNEINSEYDYLLAFTFNTTFDKNQSERLIGRLFSMLPGISFETGNNYENKEISHDYDRERGKIIYKNKYFVSRQNQDTTCLYFSFNVANPTIKWIDTLNSLFKQFSSDLGFSYGISGLNMTDSYLENNDYYKFGFFDWRHIAEQEDNALRRQIEYSEATKRVADNIAQEMVHYEPNGFVIAIRTIEEKQTVRRFDISWKLTFINVPPTFYICELYKEAILEKNECPSLNQRNEIGLRKIYIEFVRIYESKNRYIFVALYKPDKPRDSEREYNYKYTYYTFWIDKGNYLTDALKLRRTLVNTFGEGTGLNIESDILKQQNKDK